MKVMHYKDFLTRARQQVDDNPQNRLSFTLKQELKQGRFSVDCHGHLMTKRSLTRNYLLLRILGGIDPAISDVDDWLEGVIAPDQNNDIDQIIEILNQPYAEGVYQIFNQDFAPRRNAAMVALMMDLEFGLPVRAKQPLIEQVRELNLLSQKRPVLPFLALDPRRARKKGQENLYTLFMEAFGSHGHFTGVKCYPALGYLPSHRALLPIFRICEEKGIPVTSHCGGTTISTISPVVFLRGKAYARAWRKFPAGPDWAQWFARPIGRHRKDKAEFLNHPYHWKPVLEQFPRLKLNLGHMGGSAHWLEYLEKGQSLRLDQIAALMEEFPGVYADFSGLPLEPGVLEALLENPPHSILRERALYGSDYWVNITSGKLKDSITAYKESVSEDTRKSLEVINSVKWLFDL